MASTTNKKITISAAVDFTVTPAVFEPSGNLQLLKTGEMDSQKGSFKIEAGTFAGGCCGTKVFGLVKDGMVTGVEFARCKDMKGPPAPIAAAAAKAFAASREGKLPPFKPMPVSAFVGHAKRRFGLIDIGGGCITICLGDFCFFCCILDNDPICGTPIVVKG